MIRSFFFVFLAACGLLAGCGSNASTAAATTTTGSTFNDTTDVTKLPLGDYRYLTSPKVGYVFSCSTSFNGGGASVVGPWINSTAGTFNFAAKTVVNGAVAWPASAFTVTLSGNTRTFTANDLPNHSTGIYPIATTDPAHAYDQNPNSIKAQTKSWVLTANPTVAATPTCLSQGPIGFLLSGAVLYNGFDAGGRDAVAHEEQDACQGHPDVSSQYHYHSLTGCIPDPGTGHSALLGYALDGFGIFGDRGVSGAELTDLDLDACHGHSHAIQWDGATVTMYHYHATHEFPYTLGCFNGSPIKAMAVSGPVIPDFLQP